MTSKKIESLAKLRQEIDAIDDQIHDLIIRRTAIVEHVRDIKRDETVKIRPAREAEIVYRLMAQHSGHFPRRELTRIWREMIVATLGFEGPFSAAVQIPEDTPGYWDLARDQYGSFTPIRKHTSSTRVIEAVRNLEVTLGILPLPRGDDTDEDMWWRFLVSEAPNTPRVIARLPFADSGNSLDAQGLEALVICPLVVPEPTGRDRTYLAIEAEEELSRTAIENALSAGGFSLVFRQLWQDPSRPASWVYLIEVFGFVDPAAERLAALKETIGGRVTRVMHLGCYATPLSAEELNPPGEPAPQDSTS